MGKDDSTPVPARAMTPPPLHERPPMPMRPQRNLDMVARTIDSADIPLASPGTKAEAVRHLAELPIQGHLGQLVHAARSSDRDRVMKVVRGLPSHQMVHLMAALGCVLPPTSN